MTTTHTYDVSVEWTGNLGSGTDGYASFSRDHEILADGKDGIAASSDPAFRGNPSRWNMVEKARALHGDVPALCFIARSVNFPVTHEPVVHVQED
ncbi:OsmC family protein [Streptomyces sp. NBC_00102]|uniref:OsmC family protein n=1 Tax=Streptomyces sp. NBC_00102 TaxID=2975652 RepID=UPI002257FDDE|nr:hypothetical protein [Streptomyces sp. NBC_00102]MCX5396900.1 hypothetical protein [Streptomyces sp. NBC_00102]